VIEDDPKPEIVNKVVNDTIPIDIPTKVKDIITPVPVVVKPPPIKIIEKEKEPEIVIPVVNKTANESLPIPVNMCKEKSLKIISEAMAKNHVIYD